MGEIFPQRFCLIYIVPEPSIIGNLGDLGIIQRSAKFHSTNGPIVMSLPLRDGVTGFFF